MINLKWTSKAQSDLLRLYEFLSLVNRSAATRIVRSLSEAPIKLLEQPRIGEKLEEFEPREVRRIIVGAMKYGTKFRSQSSTCLDFGIHGKIVRNNQAFPTLSNELKPE